MENLKQAGSLVVQQKKEWGEILTGFETRNKYSILDASGQQLYLAAEESSLLARLLLKQFRPFTLHILSPQGNPVLKLVRPFRFYFHEMAIIDASGKTLGTIKKKFSVLSRQFTVEDSVGMEICRIHGPLLHPWTFRILKHEAETGKITKRWSGLGKEMFTDADNFNITFPPDADTEQKGVLLGALFLIDMLHFEQR